MTENVVETDAQPTDPASRFRHVIVPIPNASVKEYFLDKSLVFLVDYEASLLKKSDVFLTYLSNMNIPYDVVLTEKVTKEQYFELMKAYFTQRMLSHSTNLTAHAAQILLRAKGVPYDRIPYRTNFDEETIFQFVEQNIQIVLNWLHFLDSSHVFCIHSIQKLKEEFKPEENLEVIVDKEYVGHNVVNLYSLPFFMETYFGLKGATYREAYFQHQFEDYMFGNKRLVEYFDNPHNLLCIAYQGMSVGVIDPANPQKFIDEFKEKNDGNEPPENG